MILITNLLLESIDFLDISKECVDLRVRQKGLPFQRLQVGLRLIVIILMTITMVMVCDTCKS